MMNGICPEEEQLSAYLDGEVAVNERLALARHVTACERCQRQLEALGALSVAFQPLSERASPVDLSASIEAMLDKAGCPDDSRIYGWRPWKLVPLSLTAALTLTCGVLLGSALIEEPSHAHSTGLWMAPFEPMTHNLCIPPSTCYRKG
jgi:anti-sigma factor RsiW